MKIIILLLITIPSFVFSNADQLKEKIIKSYPNLPIKSIKKTNYNDLYEIFLGDQIIYSDESFSFLIIEGRLVNPQTKIDLTADRLEELTRINFSSLPLDKAIKIKKGSGERIIAVFSDIDCPFCRKLEKETIAKIDNITVYNFLFPLAIHPKAETKSAKVWCSKNRSEAWTNAMVSNKMPKNKGDCDTPIQETIGLAKNLGISSTPTIILPNGKRLPGAISADELEKYLSGFYD